MKMSPVEEKCLLSITPKDFICSEIKYWLAPGNLLLFKICFISDISSLLYAF